MKTNMKNFAAQQLTKFIYIITLLSCLSASAQRFRIVPLSEMKRNMPIYSGTYVPDFESFYSTAEREEIDDIALRVIYDLTVRIDTLVCHDRIVAETGSRYTSFYSMYLRELSKNHTDRNRKTSYEWPDSCSVQYSAALYVDLRRRILEECVLLPNIDNLFHTYDEPLPAIEWELDDAVCEILGYRCMKARCSFRGREWSVWYAPDLPAIAGFWKFHGLPGMVLAAKDASGEYRFRAIGIEKPAEPMLRYKVPSRKMSRERVQKAARSVYNNPIDTFFAEKGQNYFVTLQEGQLRLITHDQCSPIPYNPLELE